MPLIKATTTATGTGARADVEAARVEIETTATQETTNATTRVKGARQKAATTTGKRTTSANKMRTTTSKHAKSVPATPVQPKSPIAANQQQQHFISTSPEYERVATAATASDIDYMPHSYPNFNFDLSESSIDYDNDDLEMDDSSLAMITPPPPYVDTPLQYAPQAMGQQRTRRAATAPPPPTRKKLFQNREIFNINTPTSSTMAMTPLTPSSSSFASAITPTKLSAAAAAMFAAPPQMAQKWKQLHRKRRRRNSSSGDSKELDKLVLQSVDWDDNDIY